MNRKGRVLEDFTKVMKCEIGLSMTNNNQPSRISYFIFIQHRDSYKKSRGHSFCLYAW